MTPDLTAEKRALRAVLKERLRALSSTTKAEGGEAVARHLSPLLPRPYSPCDPAQAVAFFASTDDELDTRPLDALLRARGIARVVPRIHHHHLVFCLVDGAVHDLPRDRWGIPTPREDAGVVALRDVALVVVPGLGFDVEGGRVGYGKGYYDRALDGVDRARVVGVFLDEQRVDRVPMGRSDVRLPRLCTPALGVVDVDVDK